VHFNDSRFLERFGRRGIWIETNREVFRQLQQNRKSICLHVAFTDHDVVFACRSERNRPMGTINPAAPWPMKGRPRS
jgi:hypothetical protein